MKIYLYQPSIEVFAEFAKTISPLNETIIIHEPNGRFHEFHNESSSATQPPMNYPVSYLWTLMKAAQDDYLRLHPDAEVVEA